MDGNRLNLFERIEEKSFRLLLGNAVERAAFLDEVEAVDRDYFAVGEVFGNDAEGLFVVFRLAEGGDKDGVIDD